MKKLHLLPGTLCTPLLWQQARPLLQDAYQLIDLSIPNHLNFSQIAQQLLEQHPNQMLNLVGFSLGAYIAADFAIRYPHAVASLTLVSNSPTQLPEAEVSQRCSAMKLIEQHGYKGTPRNRLAGLLAPENQTERFFDILQKMDADSGEETLLSQYRHTTEREDLSSGLHALTCPVQLYYAENDPLIDTQWMQRLQQRAPTIRFVKAASSGHMLPLEQPQQFAQVIKSFV
ncbi:alpha/beta fold hydrolase [Alteromonas sp. a30]|uniref:alpha/beta fold hydrolase n=1 Tax=Alteromonas sp. a30 TaxID=2730917 RepID=UPI00227E73DD|nr:alpha/beta hydrolase [Alteromonas sp. a30]MCY7295590.1 alpha/beta hydrolase [Alteromonas sp. a30]